MNDVTSSPQRLMAILLVLATGFIGYGSAAKIKYAKSSPEVRLLSLWRKDVQVLEASGLLPPPWFQITDIDLIPGDDAARDWASRVSPPIKVAGQGDYQLRVLLISWVDEAEQEQGALVEYHLIHKPTGNTEWELARTYTLGHL